MFKAVYAIFFVSLILFLFSLNTKEEKSFRTILSILNYQTPQNKSYQFIKLLTNKGVVVEVFQTGEPLPKLINTFENLGEKDAHFILGGSGTQLGGFDIDHDGRPEVLVPTFDKHLILRLFIIKYNETSESFYIYEDT